ISENCPTPARTSSFATVEAIRSIAHRFGAVQVFKAYTGLNTANRGELQSAGVTVIDCPHNGRKDVVDHMMMIDMVWHVVDNPSSTIVVISADRDFSYAISSMRNRRYKVILVTRDSAHSSLKAQASVCLSWDTDVL
ncbi:limkain-b1-type NYN domain-containing protein, partial [Mycena floridula]